MFLLTAVTVRPQPWHAPSEQQPVPPPSGEQCVRLVTGLNSQNGEYAEQTLLVHTLLSLQVLQFPVLSQQPGTCPTAVHPCGSVSGVWAQPDEDDAEQVSTVHSLLSSRQALQVPVLPQQPPSQGYPVLGV
jgi:hypothetical protein